MGKNNLLSILILLICLIINSVTNGQQLFKIQDNMGYYGFIDVKGKVVIKPKYTCCDDFFEGLAAVKIGEKWGYIDTLDSIVINPNFDSAFSFSEGYALAFVGDKCGYIDTIGKFIIKPQYITGNYFSCGLACVQKIDKTWRFINKRGKVILKIGYLGMLESEIYDYCIPNYSSGFYIDHGYTEDDLTIFYDMKGRKHKISNTWVWDFYDSVATFHDEESQLYGFINPKGKIIIEPKYYYATHFIDGNAWVTKKEDSLFYIMNINKQDSIIFVDTIKLEEKITLFNIGNNNCLIYKAHDLTYINTKGERLRIKKQNNNYYYKPCHEDSSLNMSRYKFDNILFPTIEKGIVIKYQDIKGNVIWER